MFSKFYININQNLLFFTLCLCHSNVGFLCLAIKVAMFQEGRWDFLRFLLGMRFWSREDYQGIRLMTARQKSKFTQKCCALYILSLTCSRWFGPALFPSIYIFVMCLGAFLMLIYGYFWGNACLWSAVTCVDSITWT